MGRNEKKNRSNLNSSIKIIIYYFSLKFGIILRLDKYEE